MKPIKMVLTLIVQDAPEPAQGYDPREWLYLDGKWVRAELELSTPELLEAFPAPLPPPAPRPAPKIKHQAPHKSEAPGAARIAERAEQIRAEHPGMSRPEALDQALRERKAELERAKAKPPRRSKPAEG